MKIEDQESAVPRKFRCSKVVAKNVGELKAALNELPDWIPLDNGLSNKKGRYVVVVKSLHSDPKKDKLMLDLRERD